MTLWFQNSQGKERKIATVNNWPEVWKEIDNFIQECNKHNTKPFKSYYSRVWTEDNGISIIDVGSHTEFFKTDLKYEEIPHDS
jgi:hypothetical protein